jgi:D-alanine-D-alanine ligase
MNQIVPFAVVLHEAIGPDARADELDTLVQAEQVSTALQQLGWRVSTLQTGLDLAATLVSIKALRPDVVFNLVESLGGDGRLIHFIPALLSSGSVAFTGCSSDAVYLSSQKELAKDWMRLNGIATPASLATAGEKSGADTRWIVKSLWEHASFGLDDGCVVRGFDAARARIEECVARYGGEWFAEQFVEGREFNISVLEQAGKPFILPMAEISFSGLPPGKPQIVGYAAKWDHDAPEYQATPRMFPNLPFSLHAALEQVVQKCWKGFGLSGYARVDIRVDAQGTPWVLEVNANPCLSQDAGFAAAARLAGMDYEQLIGQVVDAALSKRASPGSVANERQKHFISQGRA